jgi:hypothetical protein
LFTAILCYPRFPILNHYIWSRACTTLLHVCTVHSTVQFYYFLIFVDSILYLLSKSMHVNPLHILYSISLQMPCPSYHIFCFFLSFAFLNYSILLSSFLFHLHLFYHNSFFSILFHTIYCSNRPYSISYHTILFFTIPFSSILFDLVLH